MLCPHCSCNFELTWKRHLLSRGNRYKCPKCSLVVEIGKATKCDILIFMIFLILSIGLSVFFLTKIFKTVSSEIWIGFFFVFSIIFNSKILNEKICKLNLLNANSNDLQVEPFTEIVLENKLLLLIFSTIILSAGYITGLIYLPAIFGQLYFYWSQ